MGHQTTPSKGYL
jgi:hypothetical protein